MTAQPGHPRDDRLQDLLVSHATEGLDELAGLELEHLLGEAADLTTYERAGAAIHLALDPPGDEHLPDELRGKVQRDAETFFAIRQKKSFDARARTGRAGVRGAWFLAAALLGLAVIGWWPVFFPPAEQVDYAALADQPGTVKAPWVGQVPGYENVGGDVVWSDALQAGFMRLVNLPPNKPDLTQYQLWIVDPDRDRHPIDGGVFDIDEDGEVIVAIDAKLRARDPKAFAITLEQPGGVVVSEGPLLVVASTTG